MTKRKPRNWLRELISRLRCFLKSVTLGARGGSGGIRGFTLVCIEPVEDVFEVRRDDAAVIAAGHFDVLDFGAEFFARLDDHTRALDGHGSIGIAVDEQGRCHFPALIPGATYRIVDYDFKSVREFRVEPGQALDLGDMVIARPQ